MTELLKHFGNSMIGGIIGYYCGCLIYFIIASFIDAINVYNISQHDIYFNICLIMSRVGCLVGMYIFNKKLKIFV